MPIDRGCLYSKDVQFQTRSNGQPVPISTWEFEASLKDAAGVEQIAMSTSGGHFTVFDGENGWLRIALTEAETLSLEPGQVSFVIYRTDGGRRRFAKATELVRDPE